MAQDSSSADSPRRKPGLLRDQVQLVKRKDCGRYEIVPIQEPLSFEKGFFIVIRACQLLAQKNEGLLLVGVAGPSGVGKTVFTEKLLNFMPSIEVISMNNYNDLSRIIDGNFDDPRLTDYGTLLENIHGLKEGKAVHVPIYDFKLSCRTGYRTVEVPSSRIVIIEGIYALSEKLQPVLDLRVSVTGGVHFDLVKRVLRDIQRADQDPEEIIHQISETVYPMYKAFIEPDLQTAHIKIINKFNPFTGFQNPTYILKSPRTLSGDQIKAVFLNEYKEHMEETYDIYLLPPGEDSEACQSYLRMRNRDGKYNLMFEEWVTDNPFIISPRITFEVSVRLFGGLMALGYTIAAILKRSSHVYAEDRVTVKIDWLKQLNRHYIQVQGRDRMFVKYTAEQLGLEGSYIPRTYIEQIRLEKLVNEVMGLPEDLKTKLSIDDELVSSPKEALSRAFADMRNRHLKRFPKEAFSRASADTAMRNRHLKSLVHSDNDDDDDDDDNDDDDDGFKRFLVSDIKKATNKLNKSAKIGQGGYGTVYKGFLDNQEVAIKILDDKGTQGKTEFFQEMVVLGQMRHPNLVNLIGACFKLCCLVYEYLPNGSLEDCIKKSHKLLTWQTRTRILYEISLALIFLHSNKPHPLVHGDLKPDNVLLDANFKSKIADFGFCRFLSNGTASLAYRHTAPRGTLGYIDPNFLETGVLTPGCDVYSFGVTILRVLTGKEPAGIRREVQDAYKGKSIMTMIDSTAGDWPDNVAELLACFGLQCFSRKKKSSELMQEISSGLEGILREHGIEI